MDEHLHKHGRRTIGVLSGPADVELFYTLLLQYFDNPFIYFQFIQFHSTLKRALIMK